ncbi:hypothetical protein GF339_13720 [candidate division KSB3 bacterium]|uniref:Solute-binding protein family 5 domain-containing protein n=1 Tax=candidate division KSB3 bacterium TaxID=2044937 RepID=A0A9D5JWX9_9BACT|nr:hypothetical protein [candidate division KSB3 bacterium]MBD3325638.1 hypothetical protein [candidate division KSB3 bacterium]
MLKHATWILVIVGVCVSLVGWGGTAAAAAPDSPGGAGVFKAAMTTNPPTLDAYLSSTTATRQVSIYMFETLVTFGDNYEIIPQLADSWTISEDRLTYTFTLRDGIKFHNGETLSAEDVEASFARYRAGALIGQRFDAVEAVTVIDPLTIEFTLTENMPLLVNLAMPTPFFAIYPKEISEQYGQDEVRGEDLIGTGPYKFLEWKPDVYVRLERFADYIPDERFETYSGFGGKRIPYFDEIQLIPAPEAASRIAGLETGEFDFAEAVPIASYEDLEDNPDIQPEILKPKWAIVLELNQGEPPMDDVRFRQALIYALDMDKVLQAVTLGRSEFYRTQPSIYYPEQKVFYTEAGSESYNNQDLDKVKELLEAVGYNNEPITYLSNRDFEWMYKACLSVADQWKEAGINVELQFMDWPSQIEKAKSLEGWHVNQTGWSPRFDPTQLYSSLSSQSVGAYNYSNPEMDALLNEINKGLPTEERQEVWRQIQKLVWEDVAIIRLGDYFELEATRANVQNYRPFYVTPRFWNVYRE